MKKIIFIVGIIIIIFAILLLFLRNFTVEFDDKNYGTAKFVYGDVNIETEISQKHLKQITDIFENKFLYSDSPSCSFSDEISINIDNKTFCIARDTCGLIYLIEKDMYFYLDDKEKDILHNLLQAYGFKLPCI